MITEQAQSPLHAMHAIQSVHPASFSLSNRKGAPGVYSWVITASPAVLRQLAAQALQILAAVDTVPRLIESHLQAFVDQMDKSLPEENAKFTMVLYARITHSCSVP
jgi:hypothetical protein